MHTNHVNICKFDDEEDENYKVVRGEIKKLIAASSEAPKDKVRISRKRTINSRTNLLTI